MAIFEITVASTLVNGNPTPIADMKTKRVFWVNATKETVKDEIAKSNEMQFGDMIMNIEPIDRRNNYEN